MFRITEIKTFAKPDYHISKDFAEKIKSGELDSEEWQLSRHLSRYESVMKVLKPEQCYKLVSDKTPNNFFNGLWIGQMPDINISAIVGENGMGKSSLVDLMIRLINNTAYALRYGLEETDDYHIRFVRDIYASLTFEKNDKRYTITQRDLIISFKDESKEDVEWVFNFDYRDSPSKGLKWQNKKRKNISLNEIRKKSKEWLIDLFYTIEINYSAYGNNTLDILPEYSEDEELEADERKNIDNVEEDTRIWMHNIFHKNDSYQLPLVLTPYRSCGKINYNNEQDLIRDRLCRLAMMNPSPLDDIIEGKKPYSILFDTNSLFNCPAISHKTKISILSQGLKRECQWLKSKSDADFDETVNEFGDTILFLWNKILGIDLLDLGDKLNKVSGGDGSRGLSYIVYKTIKIARTYVRFNNMIAEDLRQLFREIEDMTTSDIEENPDKNFDNIIRYLRSLISDETHVTLKLRKTLAWIIFQHYNTKNSEISLKDFNRRITKNKDNQNQYIAYLRKKYNIYDSKNTWVHLWTDEELMPCPAVKADVLFVNENNNKLKNSSLSSGERQMIGVLSAAIYHIYNLKSLFDEKSRKNGMLFYPYVNIIFEEAELYFHPKYQTQFINAILSAIKGLNLSNTIHSINLIFVTHSPFLLSDIPQGNILYMQNGLPYNQLKHTFCANVYDILADSFFMDRFVGEFAYNKVGDIINRINSHEFFQVGMDNLLKEIELIGDDFIRHNLLIKYKSKRSCN